ncbi:MAG: Protein translocase subunit SecD [Chlamydiae bacterium]|nr:Protein translocase subunit SecD [Chlamydiota bacterium]
MEKLKKGHLILIVAVVVLTIYNVLPTLIYYSKPLSKSISEKQAYQIAQQATDRVDSMQKESVDWLTSFTKHLGLKPKSIQPLEKSPQLIEISFFRPDQAKKFRSLLPRAGAMIPFAPAQLSLAPGINDNPTKVIVERKIGFSAKKEELKDFISFVPKKESDALTDSYKELVNNRFAQLAVSFAGRSSNGELLNSLTHASAKTNFDNELLNVAQTIKSYCKNFGENSSITRRYFQSFSLATQKPSRGIDPLIEKLEILQKNLAKKSEELKAGDEEKLKLQNDQKLVASSIQVIKNNQKHFVTAHTPLTFRTAKEAISSSNDLLVLGDCSPFIQAISVDWESGTFNVRLHSDVEEVRSSLVNTPDIRTKKEKLNQLIINEIARVSQTSNEAISPTESGFQVALDKLDDTQSYLLMDLAYIARQEVNKLKQKIENFWSPESPEFSNGAFPVWDYETYSSLSEDEKRFGLVVYAPVLQAGEPLKGFDNSSIYVVAKGLNPILQKYQQFANLEQAETFKEEFIQLQNIFRQQGYQYSFLANETEFEKDFHQDFIFENPSYYTDILAATRENFSVHGNKHVATLELTNLEQRILTTNKIEGQIHEELIKWKDDYQASLVDLHDTQSRFLIPPPTKNILWNNFLLNFKEYFRGDNRKVLKWGLDILGGKSILIGLKDHNNRTITGKEELSEGANELTQRVNKMGLSEVDIRVEGNHIALDFPSSKGLTASELIKGSSMSFHIINEKFASKNSPYFASMQKFLQDVWNEATITNRKDAEGINMIAWKQLGGSEDGLEVQPRTEYAKELYEHGFRLPSPHNLSSSSALETTLSSIGVYRGSDYTEWRGQTHPLIPVFNNFALEGSEIENVRTGYDPSQGNTLTFGIKTTAKSADKISPREAISSWTSSFAKDKVVGSVHEKYTLGRGWRMAIILNGQIINDPQLNQPLRDNVQVTGGFTQHEATKLASDLKAGSLSFTPHILSVENVSADLGLTERVQGITAMAIALALVIIVMVGYYRFSGIIASIAVLFNLLIMWGTLQNLQATLTLSGIAGIILTVGMAVDANVLVFERIREELKLTQRLSTAIATGYKKAFSAIFDSNITTIIAAIILLNFDAGPIKGLAITLTIGIASSMFTALFMTRAFFTKWVSQTKATTLNMANWIKVKSFDFLKHSRWVSVLSIFVIVMGATLLLQQRKSIMGMDFTGGYSVSMQVEGKTALDYRKAVAGALIDAGAKITDFQIRELNQPNSLRVQLSSALDEKGRPFFGMSSESGFARQQPTWKSNPRLSWVVEALAAKDMKLTHKSLENLDKNWSEMSGQLSKSTRNNAFIGLSLALLFILIYISFRYEIKYALSAILCIVHDIFITLALIAILHFSGVTVQINMQIIAALMTIIGYSLNDTIIVFDRIREDKKLYKKLSFSEVINHSISVTLNRTVMTSLTTFVVLLSLVLLGGSKIFDFSLVMSLGVILGTFSSLFIAPYLLNFMHQKESKTSQTTTATSRSTIA